MLDISLRLCFWSRFDLLHTCYGASFLQSELLSTLIFAMLFHSLHIHAMTLSLLWSQLRRMELLVSQVKQDLSWVFSFKAEYHLYAPGNAFLGTYTHPFTLTHICTPARTCRRTQTRLIRNVLQCHTLSEAAWPTELTHPSPLRPHNLPDCLTKYTCTDTPSEAHTHACTCTAAGNNTLQSKCLLIEEAWLVWRWHKINRLWWFACWCTVIKHLLFAGQKCEKIQLLQHNVTLWSLGFFASFLLRNGPTPPLFLL